MTDNRTLPPEESTTDSSLVVPQKIGDAPCTRCFGTGVYGDYGTCIRCEGSGTDPKHRNWVFPDFYDLDMMLKFYDDKAEENRKARERRARRKEEKRQAQHAANLLTYPSLESVFEMKDVPFIADIYEKSFKFELTAKQADAALRSWAAEQAELHRLSLLEPIREGKGAIITGTVITLRWQDNQWGGGMKMLVELDAGQRLWGTVPTTLEGVEVDDRVTFTANVSPTEDDPTFGFFSRPRKGEVVGRATDERDE